jgi:tetratricopeptide (TPR) repeat protein
LFEVSKAPSHSRNKTVKLPVQSILPVLLILAVAPAIAAADDPWLGRSVFWKPDAVAKIGLRPVRADLIPFGATVGAVEGDWLWVHRAWIRKRDVHTTEEALEFHTEQIQRDPADPVSYCRRGTVWMHKRELEKAAQDFTEAIRLDPRNAFAYSNRGSVRESLGRSDLAIQDYTRAILIDPNCALAYHNRGIAQANWGDLEQATQDLTEAIRLDPTEPLAYRNRGNVWRRRGNYDKAIQDCTTALKLDHTCIDAYNDSAWLRATCSDSRYRNGAKALTNAQQACELSRWKVWQYLGTLAAAYAELGDYDKAIEFQRTAVALTDTPSDQREELEHLERFESHRPLREEIVVSRPGFRDSINR